MSNHGLKMAQCYHESLHTDYTKQFSRLFPQLPPAHFKPAALQELAETMMADDSEPDSRVPAGYTYFGQFVDHDITQDAKGGTHPNDLPYSTLVTQLSSPSLDLDSVYGSDLSQFVDGKGLFVLGKTTKEVPFDDIPRAPNGAALIGDKRNEDNLIISQLHLLFMLFHNKLHDRFKTNGDNYSLEYTRKQVIYHYQHIVLHDYLPRIIKPEIYDKIVNKGKRTLFPTIAGEQPSIPLEFSGAAYRFGHSQVRDCYFWNSRFKCQPTRRLLKITSLNELPDVNRLTSAWVVDWQFFFDLDCVDGGSTNPGRFNFAKRIDTRLATALAKLPHSGDGVLAARNMIRGAYYGLPSAQDVGAEIGHPLPKPKKLLGALDADQRKVFKKWEFHEKTPLWFYILLEAEMDAKESADSTGDESYPYLGTIGSHIVCEVIYGLILASEHSILREGWKGEHSPFELAIKENTFQMSHIINSVLPRKNKSP